MVSVWRLLRKELALTSYSFESTFFQVVSEYEEIHLIHGFNAGDAPADSHVSVPDSDPVV